MRVRIFVNYYLLFILVFIVPSFPVCGQNLNLLTPYLGDRDKKTVDNAIEELNKAGELVKEANQYYTEALTIQSDNTIAEEEKQKKIKSIETKAITIQFKADKIYKSVNKQVIEICAKALKDKDVSNEKVNKYTTDAQEQAKNAGNKRNEASNIKNVYEKATFLNDASELESAAIDDYISAIVIVNDQSLPDELLDDSELMEGEVKTEIILSLIDTAIDGKTIDEKEKAAVYQNRINKYYDYIYDQNIKDPIKVDQLGVSGIADENLDALAAYFKGYISGENLDAQGGTQLSDSLLLAGTTTGGEGRDIGQTEKGVPSTTDQTGVITDKGIVYGQESTDIASGTGEKVRKKTLQAKGYSVAPGDEGKVRFIVQVAASRIPLTKAQLWAIYPSNLTVEVVREEGWFKYRITGFRLFSQANRVAIESGVKGAWVSATLNNEEITLAQAREITQKLEESYLKEGSKSGINVPDFYIQFAASRTPIPLNVVEGLCSEVGKCREIIEEGWYKYQYYGGVSYDSTITQSKSLTRKTFVVAYKGGTKINLYKALKKDNLNSN